MSGLEEIEKLARAIDEFDPDEAARICGENNEPPTCIACNGEYRILEPDHYPTAFDNACAHDAVTRLARALLAIAPLARHAERYFTLCRELQIVAKHGGSGLQLCCDIEKAKSEAENAIDAMRAALAGDR